MLPPASRSQARAQSGSTWTAIAQVLAGVLLFSCSDVMAKYLGRAIPAVEVAWLRYVVFTAMGVALAGRRRSLLTGPKRPWLQVIRAVAVLGSSIFFIAGLALLPIAEAAAISFVSPAFITALSVPFLGEKVGPHRWAATAVGLIGVLIVIRPGTDALQLAALWPLSSAACWAIGMTATRLIGAQDRSETTLLWSACIGLLLLTLVLPFAFVPLSLEQVVIGLLLGATASTGQYLIILAYRRASASLLAPFSYLQLLSSTLLGYLAFGAMPDAIAFAGAGVIVGSGLYIVYRERLRARQEVKTAAEGEREAVAAES